MLLFIHSLVILIWTFLLFFYFIRGAERKQVEVNIKWINIKINEKLSKN